MSDHWRHIPPHLIDLSRRLYAAWHRRHPEEGWPLDRARLRPVPWDAPRPEYLPDLEDDAVGGVLLGAMAEGRALDVRLLASGLWVVAVHLPDETAGLISFAEHDVCGDSLAEAAARAWLALYEEDA